MAVFVMVVMMVVMMVVVWGGVQIPVPSQPCPPSPSECDPPLAGPASHYQTLQESGH